MKSGFGGGLKRNRVLAEIAANSTTETRVLQLIAANASGGSAVKIIALRKLLRVLMNCAAEGLI